MSIVKTNVLDTSRGVEIRINRHTGYGETDCYTVAFQSPGYGSTLHLTSEEAKALCSALAEQLDEEV